MITIADRRLLIVDDSIAYKRKESEYRGRLSSIVVPHFYYTNYESILIRLCHRTPVIGDPLAHIAFWFRSASVALRIFFSWRSIPHKLFINPIVGFFYCFFAQLANSDEEIAIAGFLFAPKNNARYYALRMHFVNYCAKKASVIFVYSRSELSEYSALFPSLAPKLRFVLYGRDFDLFSVRHFSSVESYVAAGGVSNRDFKTLIRAMEILHGHSPEVRCKIATRTGHPALGYIPPNVEVLYNVRIDRFGDFIQNSQLVVLPLKNTPLSGGHMVLLESMARGKFVIVADSVGIRDYINPASAITYRPEDPDDLARAILSALTEDQKRFQDRAGLGLSLYRGTFTHCDLLERLCQSFCDRKSEPLGAN